MLDEFGNDLDSTESKIDSTMKKVAKVLHMNNGKLFIQIIQKSVRVTPTIAK